MKNWITICNKKTIVGYAIKNYKFFWQSLLRHYFYINNAIIIIYIDQISQQRETAHKLSLQEF